MTSPSVTDTNPSATPDDRQRYLPAAYLDAWASDGLLCEMQKTPDQFLIRQVAPADGSPVGDHAIDDVPPEVAEAFARCFAATACGDVASALHRIIAQDPAEWDGVLRENWTRFIIALVFRNPQAVAQIRTAVHDILENGARELRERYATKRSDPKLFAEYIARANPQRPALAAIAYLEEMLSGETTAKAINAMRWARIAVPRSRFTLLTSDNPLDMPLGLREANAYIALPLTPTSLFIATNNTGLLESLTRQDASKIVRMMNLAVVNQAREQVFGIDDSQATFVKNHFGSVPSGTRLSDAPRKNALASLRS